MAVAGIPDFRGSMRGFAMPGRGMPRRRAARPAVEPAPAPIDSRDGSVGGGAGSLTDYMPMAASLPAPAGAPVAGSQPMAASAAMQGLDRQIEPSAGWAQGGGVGDLNAALGLRKPPFASRALQGLVSAIGRAY